jgi:hypothetical protein
MPEAWPIDSDQKGVDPAPHRPALDWSVDLVERVVEPATGDLAEREPRRLTSQE